MEVFYQELAEPCGHKMGRHGLPLAQVSVDDDLLYWLQDHSPIATLLQWDLTLIPLIHGPL